MCKTNSKKTITIADKNQFTKKFYLGIGLVISSLIIGKITQTTFIVYFNNAFIRKASVIIYIVSWFPFLLGIAWSGRESMIRFNRFFTLKYYKDKIKSRKK